MDIRIIMGVGAEGAKIRILTEKYDHEFSAV